jgi:hypothetical protein
MDDEQFKPTAPLSIVGAMARLTSLINGCTLFTPQPKGQIVVQACNEQDHGQEREHGSFH